jgi:hypothetical protein
MAGRICVINRLTAQHHGLCFDDRGAEGRYMRAVGGRHRYAA